jgi:hypothetical protein
MKQTQMKKSKNKKIIKKEWKQMKQTKGNIVKHNFFKQKEN